MSPERPVAYILGTFPQPSQTFIAREIRGLREAGFPLRIFALRRRPESDLEAADRAWYRDVCFVPAAVGPTVLAANLHFLARGPGRYLRALTDLVRLPHRPRVLALRAIALFVRAAWVAREVERGGGCRQVHAHFALAQTEVAMAVSSLLGCPFSFTAHARDIYATPSALEEKMRAAAVVVTCTGYNAEYLRRLCPELPDAHVQLVHHGVEVDTFDIQPATAVTDAVPMVLAAGRLIEKKGFDTLVDACARLKARGVPFRCRIVGTGPAAPALRQQIAELGLSEVVQLPGWVPADALRIEMAAARVFCMPSRVSRSGDRDGIPNVVLEAMAAGLPVVATDVSGMPEAVQAPATGLLVPPADVDALADALQRMLTDRVHAAQCGEAGRQRILDEFTLALASQRLTRIFTPGAST